jgi:spore maturation protein B
LLLFLVGLPLYAYLKGVKVYESFIEGAKGGFDVAIKIIPYLVAILTVVGMFRSSGAMELIQKHAPAVLGEWGISPETIGLILVRPFSGSASLGLLGQIVSAYGADSLQARLGGVILGSTETTFYVLAVYFGAVGVTKTRYAAHAGLFADMAGVIAAIIVCGFFFR